jgi:hypothetical protein
MRLLFATALLTAGLAAGTASAQTFTFGWNPRSGDTWIDVTLGDMNRYGSRYRDPFVDEMVRYRAAPRDLVVDLLARHWAPGDIYYACALAQLIGRPCRYVVEVWERDHAQGWGAVAKRLGIRPGSAQFHQLKRSFVPSYDRWGRPIELDAQLQREFPGRARGPKRDDDHGNGQDRDDDHGRGNGRKSHGNDGPGNSGHGQGHGQGKHGGR